MENLTVKIGWSGNNYSANSENPEELNGVVLATNKTLDGVKKEFESALKFHIEGCLEDGDNLQEYIAKGDYKINYELCTSALLHSLDGILTRSAIARSTGINERQIGHYASGHRTPRPVQRKKILSGIHKIGRELIEA
ncbi:MAG: CopG family transcriptional regulator [Prevotellaceae bacterium]|jgi:hypothetical protein|nr:CopG family transcriptional regulator [Prevotellaceae bacterium]